MDELDFQDQLTSKTKTVWRNVSLALLVSLFLLMAGWACFLMPSNGLMYGESARNSEVVEAEDVGGVAGDDLKAFANYQDSRRSGQSSIRRRSRGGRSAPDRSEYTMWEIEKEFSDDVFTFVRIQFDSGGRARGGGWANDYPDCDWNFSVRLHELTSLKVDPNGKVIRLTDPELFEYPWVFMSNVNRMNLDEAEVEAMRKYCLRGGFVMADDFWAPQGWRHVRNQMKRVFPDREPKELPRDHEIFNLVYDLKGVPQVPSIFAWQQGYKFEYWHGDPEGDEGPHFWGYFDDNDRLMALMCHNNDIGDGWEREGENKEYFEEYSERVSYPLGINIITYVMTH